MVQGRSHQEPDRMVRWVFRLHRAGIGTSRGVISPLRFAITSRPSRCEEDLHLPAVDHARPTKQNAPDEVRSVLAKSTTWRKTAFARASKQAAETLPARVLLQLASPESLLRPSPGRPDHRDERYLA